MARIGRWAARGTLVVFALLATFSNAHSELVSGFPAAGPAHAGPPDAIVLEFTEPVEARFSTFDLYLLDVGAAWPTDPRAPSEAEWTRLEMLVGAFTMRTRIGGAPAPGGAHVTSLASRTRGATRSIRLEATVDLEPGAYVISWATVATDGHVMLGHHAFLVVDAQ